MTIEFEQLRAVLTAAALSDALDGLGRTGQAMRPFVRPLDDGVALFGRARTGLFQPLGGAAIDDPDPYGLEIALVDDLRPEDVPVLACGGPTDTVAPWGELLSTAARARGAAGCVTDGLVRDVRAIRGLGFPVFHGGVGPLDTRGRAKMAAIDGPVTCGGVEVHPGDLVFGDADGVVVLPHAIAAEAIAAALVKLDGEGRTRQELEGGLKLAEVYARHGVL